MTQEETIKLAQQCGISYRAIGEEFYTMYCDGVELEQMCSVIRRAVEAERAALEQELLKLRDGIAANSEYIQGRWDLIGEFQDVLRARGER